MFTTLTVILDRSGRRQEFQFFSDVSVGYAARRIAYALRVNRWRCRCALGNPETGNALDPEMVVSEVAGPVLFMVEER